MAEQRIIRLPLTGADDESFVIVNVISNGPLPLDIKLLASEGNYPFVGQIEQRRTSKLRVDKRYNGSAEEWEAVLSYVLLQKDLGGEHAEAADGVEIVSSLANEDELKVVVQKRVGDGGILVTLGVISLTKDEEEEIDPLAWAGIAAQAAAVARDEVAELKSKLDVQQETVRKLNEQLEDLIKTKEENEIAMLEKFKELLNEKKLKIRDQQRLLAEAKVNPATAVKVQGVRDETKTHKAAASRASKRKASRKQPVLQSESEDDEFEHVWVGGERAEEQRELEEDMPEAVTPNRTTDDETEDEDDLNTAPSAFVRPSNSTIAEKGEMVETAQKPEEDQTQVTLPPRRELPFAKRNALHAPIGQKPLAIQDEEDTEDDEL
ncbi:hypothetical protein AOQ84DRAFT_357522 [Glonium stellatum]|uniref:Mitotic apparatus protein p62 n=1 Tax=Glonium stellatum TaxID=574774 RepID=A0A8E2EPB4_9PEZI|nr:hypothetical protein AOQ84DRAFT_357522 [Glonium stellatum]